MLPTNTIFVVSNFHCEIFQNSLIEGTPKDKILVWWISRYWGTVSLEFTGGKNVDLLEILNYTLES